MLGSKSSKNKNILRIMLTENSVKLTNNFYCEKCDYKSCRKNDFNKHLQSKKHNAQNSSKMLFSRSNMPLRS